MADIKVPYAQAGIAAFEQGDDFIGVELFSGSTPLPATEDFAVQAGVALAAFAVVALVGNYLVMADEDFVAPVQASATITFSGQPTAADTVTVNGQVYTFRAALTGAANEVLIGANQAATQNNLIAAINTDAGAGATYGTGTAEHATAIARLNSSTIVGLAARTAGVGGNALTLAKSGANIAVSAANFAGGLDQVGAAPIGVTTAPVKASATDQRVAAFRSGCFNPEALTWHASYDTDAKKAAAFRGSPTPTNILIRKFASV